MENNDKDNQSFWEYIAFVLAAEKNINNSAEFQELIDSSKAYKNNISEFYMKYDDIFHEMRLPESAKKVNHSSSQSKFYELKKRILSKEEVEENKGELKQFLEEKILENKKLNEENEVLRQELERLRASQTASTEQDLSEEEFLNTIKNHSYVRVGAVYKLIEALHEDEKMLTKQGNQKKVRQLISLLTGIKFNTTKAYFSPKKQGSIDAEQHRKLRQEINSLMSDLGLNCEL